jgi:zinc resistance-associated protein
MYRALIAAFAGFAFVAALAGAADEAASRRAHRHGRDRINQEDLARHMDTRFAAIKDSLELSKEQERHWPRLEQALRDVTAARQERLEAWRERGRAQDPVEIMRDQADALSERAGDLRKLATAIDPLYRTLSDEQKRRLFAQMRITPVRLRHRGRRRHWWRWRH